MLTTIWKNIIGELRGGYSLPDNVLVTPPQIKVSAMVNRVDTVGYAADTYIIATKAEQLREGLRNTESYLELTDQDVNPKNSLHGHLIGAKMPQLSPRVDIKGAIIPLVREFRSLGAQLTFDCYPHTVPC